MIDSVYALEQMSRMHIERMRLDSCPPCRIRALLRRV